MPLTFTRAQEVMVGQAITSSQMASMANAFNDRIKSGLGDAAWRIHHYAFNFARQIRNPDALGAFPTQGEFQEFYANVNPDWANLTWPGFPHGDPEGANLATPIGGFVGGRPGIVSAEGDRLDTIDPWYNGTSPPANIDEEWVVAAQQRGAYDPATGGQASPALDAAQSFYRLIYDGSGNGLPGFPNYYASPHGTSYGGFQPLPVNLGPCGANPGDPDSYQIKFTGLNGKPDKVYVGTCPPGTADHTPSHVKSVQESPYAYFVELYDGTVDRLPRQDYLEGPYEGFGVLQKGRGDQLSRALNHFLHGFRGTQQQIDNADLCPSDRAFDFDAFFTTQYGLAPAYGVESPPGTVTAVYPEFSTLITLPGTVLGCDQGGTAYQIHSGFTFAGYIASATSLVGTVTVEILDGANVIHTFSLTSASPGARLYFDAPFDGANLSMRIATGSTGVFALLTVQTLEQLIYLPELPDAYAVLRLSATSGNALAEVDGDGKDVDDNVAILNDFVTRRFIQPKAGARGVVGDTDNLSTYPVVESFRRFYKKNLSQVNRNQLVSYEFDGTDSILVFKRYPLGQAAQKLDSFAGIAPHWDDVASGDLILGCTYVVRVFTPVGGDSVTYGGVTYTDGQTFVANAGTVYTSSGNAFVYLYEGVIPIAPKGGWSNEWVLFLQTLAYSDSATSEWKWDAYTDYFTWSNRCHWQGGGTGSGGQPVSQSTKDHFNDASFRTQANLINPESPTGYNYMPPLNDTSLKLQAERQKFFKSCQVYQKPYVVKSATVQWVGGEERVIIKLTGRIHHDSAQAPATISPDVGTWSAVQLATEEYRTDENAIREYLFRGTQDCVQKWGDREINGVHTGGQPEGTCVPRFFFTRLVPRPYDDGNDIQDMAWDTELEANTLPMLEWYLRAMCEGWVDKETSEAISCDLNGERLVDFTYENLCLSAFGGRWISMIPSSQRSPQPQGFGQMPGQVPRAELWNQLAKCINALDTVRIILPTGLEIRQDSGTVEKGNLTWNLSEGACQVVFTNTAKRAILGVTPDPVESVTPGTWTPTTQAFSSNIESFLDNGNCPNGDFVLTSLLNRTHFRFQVSDPDAALAVDQDVLDLLESDGVGLLALVRDTLHTPKLQDGSPAEPCSAASNFLRGSSGTPSYQDVSFDTIVEECRLITNAELNPGAPVAGDYWTGWTTVGQDSCGNYGDHEIVVIPETSAPLVFVKVPLI